MDQRSISMSTSLDSGSVDMSEEIFTQTIFPPLEKKSIQSFNFNVPNITNQKDDELIHEIYCGIQMNWVSMIECVDCKNNTRTLEQILDDELGCYVDEIQGIC